MTAPLSRPIASAAALKVLFAPDWRREVPYQRLLAEALCGQGMELDFLSGYRRGLPLWRGVRDHPCDVLHLHWPEAYFSPRSDWMDFLRQLRFPVDLLLALSDTPLVLTAHNLLPHHTRGPAVFGDVRFALRRASMVIAHSEAAKARLLEVFAISPERCRVIPHGDLSDTLGAPVPRETARERLGLPAGGKSCLLFGSVAPYKGIEEVVGFWKREKPEAQLAIVGKPVSEAFAESLGVAAAANILTRFKRLEDEELKLWLCACDCAVFNYRAILTSGAACLARSWGLPILFPSRLGTVDLDEPSPLVFRFGDMAAGFARELPRALDAPGGYAAAAQWREKTAWEAVARATVEVYRSAVGEAKPSL